MAQVQSPPKLSTRRLNLRAPSAADAPVLARLVDDVEIARMTTAIPHPYPHNSAEGFINRMTRADAARERLFAVEAPDEGFVGLLGFHPNETGVPDDRSGGRRPGLGRRRLGQAVRHGRPFRR
jgi:RimJ/RimL family protein N-acetyltransferase